jgi:hypothetical protein
MNATRQKRRHPRTPEQEAAARERREQIKAIARAISQMSPDQRQDYIQRRGGLLRNIEGKPLSVRNCCFILWQNPHATIVAGFRQWLKAGRVVKKGEAGIKICIPLSSGNGSGSGDMDGDGDGAGEDAINGGLHFGVATVFDIEQTEPKEAADAAQANGEPEADGEQEAAAAPAPQPQRVTIHTPATDYTPATANASKATAAQGITGTEQLLFA